MEYNSSFNPNFAGVKNTSNDVEVRSDEGLRKFLVQVGINEGQALQIDQFFHNDLPSANLSPEKQRWVESYYDIISGYLLASTTNQKSGRKYDWTPLILKAYERAKTLTIVSKSENGWMTLNVLKREMIQRYHEDTTQSLTSQTKKPGWFDANKKNEAETNSYGKFERSG